MDRHRTFPARAFCTALAAGWLAMNCPAGPTPSPAESHDPARTRIVAASFYPMYILGLQLLGGLPGIEVVNLTRPATGCLHDYQLTPGDLRTLFAADVLLTSGAGMETFLDKVITQIPRLRVIEVSAGLELIREACPHGHRHGDGVCGEPNPHVWVSPAGARAQLATAARALAEALPDLAPAIAERAAAYDARLADLQGRMRAAIDRLPNKRIVTFHEAFPYFAREFGLEVVAVVQREPGSEPSSGELARLVEVIRAGPPLALFVEPQFPPASADIVGRETGLAVHVLDPVVTGPAEPALAREAYLRAMERNLAVLGEALR